MLEIRNWKMKEAYNLAPARAKKRADMGKRQYDKKIRHTALCKGDRVLVRNMTNFKNSMSLLDILKTVAELFQSSLNRISTLVILMG